ncbi:hypothetical protein [Parapedobacter pyrenivorans]|uniref:hypothetical protein n=1 Tax=Parapedobacter pyrenivorans TaxID=1305674 RepID=UPI003340CC59
MIGIRYYFMTGLLACLLLPVVSCKKDGGTDYGLPQLGTCRAVGLPNGLHEEDGQYYAYTSSTGTDIKLDRRDDGRLTLTMTFMPFPGQYATVQLWGNEPTTGAKHVALFENLNGKLYKQRKGKSRTFIFPDGLKITLVAAGPRASVTAISIYDGGMAHHLNITCNTVEYGGFNPAVAKGLDDRQPDGETSMFELRDTHLILYNAYTEDVPGKKIELRVDLGSLEKGKPTLVNDLYDDPELDFT